jgi:hypothetical protein
MTGQDRLRRALEQLSGNKEDRIEVLPGKLGGYVGSSQQVIVPGRPDFVFVRINGKDEELIQAFNDEVADIWNTPVLVARDKLHPRFYRVLKRDISKYGSWGGIPYLPFHGEQHSFSSESGTFWDIVWVYKRQFMPLLLRPNDNTGSMSGYVEADYYLWNNQYKHFGGTGTVDFTSAKPGAGQGRFITVYLDGDTGNLGYVSGSVFSTLLPPSDMIPYIPVPSPAVGIPVGAVALYHTTTSVNWNNLFDVRAIVSGIGSAGVTPSQHYLDPGSGTHTGLLNASNLANHTHSLLSGVTSDQHHNRLHGMASAADHSGTFPASSVSIVDSGGFYSGSDVEGALQEIAGGGGGGGSVDGSGTVNQVAYWTDPNTIDGDDGFKYTSTGTVGLIIGGSAPVPSAILEVISTSRGFLAPRMTESQRNAISFPANALLIYNTDDSEFNYYDGSGSSWVAIAGGIDQHYLDPASGTHLGLLPATISSIVDSGGYFASSTVEGALQELGAGTAGTGTSSDWLAAAEAWTFAADDDPTFTLTFGSNGTGTYWPGMRIRLIQTSTKYFILTKVDFSSPNTTLTLYGGTDYNLVNAAIVSPHHSTAKSPWGFPLDPTKWTVQVEDTTLRTQATPTASTWYNPGSITISIPIGIWNVAYRCSPQVDRAAAGDMTVQTTLSTANNSESDGDLSSAVFRWQDDIAGRSGTYLEKVLVLTAKTSYFLNIQTINASMTNIYLHNGAGKAIIRAVCTYL